MKSRKHSVVVTFTTSRELEPRSARYWLKKALSDRVEGVKLGAELDARSHLPITIVRTEVKDLGRVIAKRRGLMKARIGSKEHLDAIERRLRVLEDRYV